MYTHAMAKGSCARQGIVLAWLSADVANGHGWYVLCIVYPEEVGIQHCLYYTSDDRNCIEMAVLSEISPDPIRYVQGAVGSECEEIMRGDRFGFTSPLEHEELW